jgi:uncharacterized protein (TIGR03083 family)
MHPPPGQAWNVVINRSDALSNRRVKKLTGLAICHRVEPPEYARLLKQEGERFIAVSTDADPDIPIPSCPGWKLADLITHVGGLYRWAEAHVRLLSPRRIAGKELELDLPEDRAGYPDWLRAGLQRLIDATAVADPDAELWAWGADKRARFWPRRMLFETVIHRIDAELALSHYPDVAPDIACDGIDEFLDNLPHAAYFAPKVDELRGSGEVVRLSSTDRDTVWTIHLEGDGFCWDHEAGADPDVTVAASASELLMFVYGRREARSPSIAITGNETVLTRWVQNSAI